MPCTLLQRSLIVAVAIFSLHPIPVLAQSMGQEQMKEREELNSMKNELRDVKSNIDKTLNSLNDLANQMQRQDNEVHLVVKDAKIEVVPGKTIDCITYNGKMPGPTIRAREGAPLRVVLHNQLHESTSLIFHGLMLPQSVSGLPHKNAGNVGPGQTYAYQFAPTQAGTFWYHPQINHAFQKTRGLYGALIVEPSGGSKSYDRDFVMIFSEAEANPGSVKTGPREERRDKFFLLNGMTANTIKPIELRKGERVRLRFINASSEAIPLSLTGHKLEVISINGSDALEPHVFRDTITVNPSDRVDAEFTADNPGVWSLASEVPWQASNQGVFPGGIACVVRYLEFENEK
jgi:FtsP/CotA-like multicopper oxidase with cupredoxin domain